MEIHTQEIISDLHMFMYKNKNLMPNVKKILMYTVHVED